MAFFLVPMLAGLAGSTLSKWLLGATVLSAGSEIARRLAGEGTEGLFQTEELPARTGLRLYVEGIMPRAQFEELMRQRNIRPDHAAAMMAFADNEIAKKSLALRAKSTAEVVKAVEKELKAYDDIYVGLVAEPLDDIEKEVTALYRELDKLAVEETEASLLRDIKLRESVLTDLEKKIKELAV